MTEQNGIVELNDVDVDFVNGAGLTLDEVASAVGGFFSWLGGLLRDIAD